MAQLGIHDAGASGDRSDITPSPTPSTSKSISSLPSRTTQQLPETTAPSPTPSSIRSVSTIDPKSTHGNSGTPSQVVPNYIRLTVERGRGIFEYAVTFNPPVDSIGHRRRLLRELESVLGKTKSFDGGKLYLPHKLRDAMTPFDAQHPSDGSPVSIYVKYIREQPLEDCIHLYNVLFRRIMKELQYTQVGRNYFDSHGGIPVPQHKLEIWPGYVTNVSRFEDGLMLNLDASHRVLRNQTVLEIFKDLVHKQKDWRDEAKKIILGSSIMTRYNNKHYRVDDILFDMNPKSTFKNHLGEEISFISYYKKSYDIDIIDHNQPLLLHLAKPNRGESSRKHVCLIPELSNVTGHTEDMRKDMKVMKDVASHTRLTPNQRKLAYEKYLKNIQCNEKARNILAEWGLHLDTRPLMLDGRVLLRQEILLGGGKSVPVSDKFDWGVSLTREKVFLAVEFRSWSVIFTRHNRGKTEEFVDMMMKVCPSMGLKCVKPNMIPLNGDRNDDFLRAIRQEAGNRVQIVVTVCPTSRDDRYAAIKKLCYVELAIPSQVINVRTISMPQKLRSVTQKVALQMNCKVGGELWALSIPLSGLMVVGIDVYHDGAKRGQSVLGFVSSMNAAITRWHSKVNFQQPNQEISDVLESCMLVALKKWVDVNHQLPARIIVFRDGVSDGQLNVVEKYEVEHMKKGFAAFDGGSQIKLSVVIVQKRTNTRLMAQVHQRLENPSPGTVVDHTITRFNMYDFFLVSQYLTQGTASPTHYIVLKDENRLKPDHMQQLSYKLTHLYYNWPGTVSVPAPCQYAHKLAQIHGQHLHKPADQSMSHRLFYL